MAGESTPTEAGTANAPAGTAMAQGWPEGWESYRFVRLLGVGGMSRVFRAWDPRLRREVAIKLLRRDDPGQVQRFLREAQAQARVDHPNVCKVYEVGEVAGQPYIAMQLIEGEPLGAAARDTTIEQKAFLVKQVAEAVQAAHRLGLIHRDLKPSNVMVETSADGTPRPYVVDFGLVRELGAEPLTVAGAALGTPSFMAPEQAVGDAGRIDRRTDVYGLGATLYALLADEPPFVATMPLEVLRKVLDEEPAALRQKVPGVPADLDAIVMKCLEKDPARRYESARALADDLSRFLDGRPVQARPTALAYRLVKRARRHKALVAVAAVALLAVSAFAGMWLHARRNAARQVELAQRFGQKVEQIEGILWRAQSLELHDIRPTRALVRTRLGEIEREMRSLGKLAEGPGHSALGRGYLALQEMETAKRHLEAAWAGGSRSPDVAYALGVVNGHFYQGQLATLSKIANHAERERRRQEAERTYRDPALEYLRASAGAALAAPELLEALLAYYEGTYDRALALAEAAFHKVPWLYEAKVVEGRTHTALGDTHQTRGRYEQALASYAAADEAYRAAARIGRSASAVHERLCRLWTVVFYVKVWAQGGGTADDYAAATAACRDFATVDPDSGDAVNLLSDIHTTWAEQLTMLGDDATEAIRDAIRAGEMAVTLAPEDPDARTTLATALWEKGKAEIEGGGDPRPSFAEGRQHLERALALQPEDSAALNVLGLLLLDQGLWEGEQSLDPIATLEQSTRAFQEAWKTDPGSAATGANLAMTYEVRLLHEVYHDTGTPEATAAEALEVIDRTLAIDPRLFFTLRTLGSVRVALAEHDRRHGKDPRPQCERAVEALRKALASNPNDQVTLLTLTETHLVMARFELAQGRSPLPALSDAGKVLARLLEIAPKEPRVATLSKEIGELSLAWRRRSG